MSLWQSLTKRFSNPANYIFQVEPEIFGFAEGQTPAQLFKTQANLRRVIGFRQRNVAQLKLQLFERNSDTDRTRVHTDPLIQLLNHPNADMTRYELLERLVGDLDLYDTAYWLVLPDSSSASGWSIHPIPPTWVTDRKGGTVFAPDTYVIQAPSSAGPTEVSTKDLLIFHGYNPDDPSAGASPIHDLKGVMAEQIAAWEFRQQMWKRGGRIGMYLTRPKDAPAWNEAQRKRFAADWKEFQDKGSRAGSSPLLEDGMEMKKVGFNAKEEEWSATAKLSLETIAGLYGVNPVMIGDNDSSNFSNTKEFRKMLYSETLGPLLEMITDRLNSFLLPKVSTTEHGYLEFNIEAKLRGDFEEEAGILSTSTGAPWMTVNEARARKNLPPLEGADQLVVPLNVTLGGQASPQDGGTPTQAVEDALKQWRARCQRVYSANPSDFPEKRLRAELHTDLTNLNLDYFTAATLAQNSDMHLTRKEPPHADENTNGIDPDEE